MPEEVIGRVHELEMSNNADVDNGHDDILDYDDESGENEDLGEAQVMQHEYNHEDLDQNSGVFLPDPIGENYENTVDQNVTDDNDTNAI